MGGRKVRKFDPSPAFPAFRPRPSSPAFLPGLPSPAFARPAFARTARECAESCCDEAVRVDSRQLWRVGGLWRAAPCTARPSGHVLRGGVDHAFGPSGIARDVDWRVPHFFQLPARRDRRKALSVSEPLKTINPATGTPIETYALMSDETLEQAINGCHESFVAWRKESPEKRAKVMSAIGEALRKNKDELAQLMTAEMGKLVKQAAQEVDLCAAICDYTAEQGPSQLQHEERALDNGGTGIISYSPIGVVYGIQPWNFPFYQVVRYSIANLMAGNGVLLKHAECVTGCAKRLAEVYRSAGLPQGLFTVLLIDHDQSDAVIRHPKVRGVTFTGSAKAGAMIAEKAGKALKKTVLELGSNDAYLVLDDADIELAVKHCVKGRTYNNGETCIAAKRFVVVDAVYDEFRDKFVAQMKKLKVGDPSAPDSHMGPMAREDLRDGLHEQVQKSVKKGAKILCGGEVPKGAGFFYPATVLDDVTPGQPAYDEELFGPVASLIRAKDSDDAMRIANDSRFGLGGGIFSKNIERARKLAIEHFDTGMVFINGFGLAIPNMPFGGVKDSGYGREHGGFGMREFVNVKSVVINK